MCTTSGYGYTGAILTREGRSRHEMVDERDVSVWERVRGVLKAWAVKLSTERAEALLQPHRRAHGHKKKSGSSPLFSLPPVINDRDTFR